MSRVFLDTNILIYLMEDAGALGDAAYELLQRLAVRRDLIYTSTMTLGEVLTQPLSKGHAGLMQEYEKRLTSPGVHLMSFDVEAARIYARVRQDRTIKAPDAVQLSVAAASKCDLFVTNDDRLSRKVVPGIQFISSLAKVPV
jgi:predicted nucleic acid-binding protein